MNTQTRPSLTLLRVHLLTFTNMTLPETQKHFNALFFHLNLAAAQNDTRKACFWYFHLSPERLRLDTPFSNTLFIIIISEKSALTVV